MKKIALILLVVSTNWLFGADNSDIIWTWGNGRNIASILSFLYFLLNIDTLAAIIKYAGLIGMLIVFIREYTKGIGFQPGAAAIKMLFFIIVSQITIYGFLSVERDDAHHVYILSANELSAASWQKCRPVNGDNECYAPIGVKMLMTYATNFERAGIGMMESSMMDANALTYSFSRMGLGFGFTFYDHISKTKGDPYTYNTFMEFYENCIIYDLADGTKSVDGIYKSRDLASYILSPNARLTNVYSVSNPNGVLKTCYEVSSASLWGNINCDSTAKKLQAKASGSAASEASTDDICLAAQNFGQLMFNSTKDASAQIEQRTIMNLTNESIVNSAIASGIDPNILAYGTTMADREQRSKFMVLGVMAKEWIPSMRGMMQGIALGLIWVLAILSIMTASPAPYLGSVVGFQVTLIVWSFILALINFMTIDKMAESLPNIFFGDLGVGDQMTLWSQPTFDEENQKALAFLGYMGFASYGIAASLVYFGGNKLASSFSGAVGSLSVGMGTSANMAKGHFDHGMDKSDSSGVQHLNRDGSIDKINSDGYQQTQKSRAGQKEINHNIQSESGGFNTMTERVNESGEKSMEIKDGSGNNSATFNSKGEATSAKLTGVSANATNAFNHTAEKMKGEAANAEETGHKTLTSAVNDTNTTAQEFVQGVDKQKGSSASTDVAKNYNEQTQHNLTEAFKDINGSQESLQKLRGIDLSAGVGFKAFGTGVEVTGKSSAQSNDTVSVSLSKEEAAALSNSMATGLAITAKTTEGLSNTFRDGITQKTDTALTKTNQASDSYDKSNKLTETASKLEKYAETNGVNMNKDVMLEVTNAAVHGDEKLGIKGLGFEKGTDKLFNDKGYLEEITKKVVDGKVASTIQKVDTDSVFNKVGSGLDQTKGNVHPVNINDPKNINLNDVNIQDQETAKIQGNKYLDNMPNVDNAPTIPTDNHVKNEYEVSKAKHDEHGKNLLPNAVPDNVKKTAQELGNVQLSLDGTYSGTDGIKHDWANKGRTEH